MWELRDLGYWKGEISGVCGHYNKKGWGGMREEEGFFWDDSLKPNYCNILNACKTHKYEPQHNNPCVHITLPWLLQLEICLSFKYWMQHEKYIWEIYRRNISVYGLLNVHLPDPMPHLTSVWQPLLLSLLHQYLL